MSIWSRVEKEEKKGKKKKERGGMKKDRGKRRMKIMGNDCETGVNIMPSAVVTLIGAIDVITQPSPKDRVRWCVKLNVSNTSHSPE